MTKSGATELKGRDYVAVVRLSTQANNTLAEPGQTCDRVPAASLGWLLADGLIVPKAEVAKTHG